MQGNGLKNWVMIIDDGQTCMRASVQGFFFSALAAQNTILVVSTMPSTTIFF